MLLGLREHGAGHGVRSRPQVSAEDKTVRSD